MPDIGEPLSEREIDVLHCLVEGAVNKEIAHKLSISPNTVKVHLRNIFTKLNATTRTEAVRIAFEQGLVAVPGQPTQPGNAADALPEDEAAADETAVSHPAPINPPLPQKPRPNRQIIILASLLFISVLVIGIVSLNSSNKNEITPPTSTVPPAPYPETDLGNNWSETAPLPQPTSNMATIAIGLQIYLIAGETASGIVDTVRLYDTVTHLWSTGEPKPTAVIDATAAALFGEIYIAGGRLANGTVTNVVEVYSPANNAWRTVASLPQPLAGGLLLSNGSFLYLLGGDNGTETLNTVYIYDFDSDSWDTLPEMRQARTRATGGEVNGLFYIVGGENNNTLLKSCEQFNPVAETWTDCPDMQQARSRAGAATLVNKLYVMGGTATSTTDAASALSAGVSHQSAILSEQFDPRTNTWEALTIPISDAGHWTGPGVTRVETRIYAVGGQLDEQIVPNTYIYAPLAYRTYLPAASGGE